MQPQHRLRARTDFERTRRRGHSWGAHLLSLTAAANDLPVTRCGFVVSKRVGNAVVRNRVRRRLRELVRQAMPRLAPGWDLILSARPTAAAAEYDALATAVNDLFRRAALRPIAPLPAAWNGEVDGSAGAAPAGEPV